MFDLPSVVGVELFYLCFYLFLISGVGDVFWNVVVLLGFCLGFN